MKHRTRWLWIAAAAAGCAAPASEQPEGSPPGVHFRGDGAEMRRGLNEALRGILAAVEPVTS